jgi:EAL domain-containing protein (putative c-di-GMP-specific phosphodiesterase class I)
LESSGLPPAALELEITENIALVHDEDKLAGLQTLKARGVGLAFDDFGTGYASLSYLTRFPLTRIKIDQSFVRRITDASTMEDTAIVRSMIIMAHNLRLEVVAEGVETAAQAAFLRAQNCDEVQGFLFAKALPIREFEELLRLNTIGSQTCENRLALSVESIRDLLSSTAWFQLPRFAKADFASGSHATIEKVLDAAALSDLALTS